MNVTITLNGTQVTHDVEPRRLLVHYIREDAELHGTHWGCDTSNCGACVVLMDGKPVKSCTILAAMAEGHEIRTVESLETDGKLDPVQEGFYEKHALQCGFCTPGMLMTARALLDENPDPTEAEIRTAISGGICRCTGYKNIVAAVRWAAEHRRPHMAIAEERPVGFGRLKRKEDPRFIRGQGNYLDDIRLPGMVYGQVLRSPYAHARIVSIDTSRALAHPGVAAVVTAKDLETLGLAWMPTISYDTQAVLAGDKVRFQGQEVAFVIAVDEYTANDALSLIDVEYDPLPPVVNARKALDPDAPLIRDDKAGQRDNLASPTWEAGDEEATDRAFAEADTIVTRDIIYPRCHPAPLETCGMIADFNPETGQLDIYNGNQAPNAHRTVYAHVAGLAEHMIRIKCNDIGGGFGNKVPVYPGYVCAIAGSIVAGVPVKWIEDRTGNLTSTGFARDYIMHAEMCAKDGKITGLRVDTLADHGAFDSTAQPTKFPAGFFHIVCGSYDLQAAHVKVKAVYTNKAPGGVAYRCSFRITEAVYLVERMVDALALEMKKDPIDLRMGSFIKPEQFPYETTTGWTYDSGEYAETMKVAMDIAGYDDLRREQAEKRERGELMGIGVSFFTEGVGAGPRKHMDILGLAMNDGADLRVHPSGKAVVSISAQTQGQGHETTFAQIVAEELGIPPEDVLVRHGDTDRTPYGLGTYGSRSTPVSGAAVAVVSRKVRDKARAIAGAMLETRPEDLAWEKGRWFVKGDPEQGAMIEEIASYAYSGAPMPEGQEGGLDAQVIYDPPNLTYPYGAYIAVVDVDADTGHVTVRRFIAVDDCGVRINPMIVDGQIHGGLAEGIGIALMELISFDAEGNCLNSSFMDYLIPTALECPDFELGETVTPCPHHPLGAKGVGESPNVGSPPAIVNAVIDALQPLGVDHLDMPCTPARVWAAMQGNAAPPQ